MRIYSAFSVHLPIDDLRAAIDNHRVLHGRSAFNGTRRMCGAYVGADEFRSRLAVLGERFAPKVEGEEGRTAWSLEF